MGEPGIGKTRLVEDLAERARRLGFTVAVGRCSQDDGAPPLWPWRSVLETLGSSTVEEEPVDGELTPAQTAFARWNDIARRVVDAATTTPLLVVLEDLHWADEATLRTLAHLLATAPPDATLCVVGTRRAQPEPTGALALVAESFARRHAARVDVTGLDREGTAALLDGMAADVPVPLVDAWHARSGGNPFFLVELARLGQGDPDHVPATVRDVVTRRLSELPERARQSLVTAAVTGRRFRPEVVAAANGTDLDDVADDLDAARAADLVVEGEHGELAFAHALTRDAVYLAEPEHRRARRHARVAHAFETDPAVRRADARPGADRRAGPPLAGRGEQPRRPGVAGGSRGGGPGPFGVGARRGDAAARGGGRGPPPRRGRCGAGAVRPAARAGDRRGVRRPLDSGRGRRCRGDHPGAVTRLAGPLGRGGQHPDAVLRVDPARDGGRARGRHRGPEVGAVAHAGRRPGDPLSAPAHAGRGAVLRRRRDPPNDARWSTPAWRSRARSATRR